jgi:hypothetical protein
MYRPYCERQNRRHKCGMSADATTRFVLRRLEDLAAEHAAVRRPYLCRTSYPAVQSGRSRWQCNRLNPELLKLRNEMEVIG